MDANEIIKHFSQLVSDRKNIEGTWDAINRYVTPYRGAFFRDDRSEQSINWRENRLIYDSTAPVAAGLLASSIHSTLTSPATRWFDIVYKNNDLNKDNLAKQWAENATDAVFQALQDSNFNLEANETYIDLTTYGTSIIVEEEDEDDKGRFNGVCFQSVPVQECHFEEGIKNTIVNFYRHYKWTPLQIQDKFLKYGPLPERIQTMITAGRTDKQEVIFCIFERMDKQDNHDSPTKLAPKERPFGYKYILREGVVELGEEGGYYEMPAFALRWRKTNHSHWGNSPAMMALPDILTLNQMVEMILKSAEKAIDPPTLVTERGLLSDIDLAAGGKTVVRSMEDMMPYESKARFDVSELQREALQRSIRQCFYVDQLQLKDTPAMTATEANIRWELMQRLLGPTLGRLESDYLDPMIQRTFNILYRAGRLGTVPQVVLQAGAELDVTYIGPLSRAQKSDVAQSIIRWAQALAALQPVASGIVDVPNWDKIAVELGSLEGVPMRLMNSEMQVKAARKQRQAVQAVMDKAATASATGKGMEQVGKGVTAMKTAGVDPNAMMGDQQNAA